MAIEDLTREQHVEGSSDRAFGLVFTGVFLLIASWPLIHLETPRWWAFAVATVFAVVSLLKPALLTRPNKLWTRLGILLGNIVGPIALGVVFYGVVSPLGIILRLTGKDPLRLKLDRSANSYWIPREPPGPPPDSLTDQF
jgi:hypothetical protein